MSHQQNLSTLRIIAGKFRSRKIYFAEKTDLRPTQDRIRETVFNWLNPFMVDAVCLDLFAGSGALGFEALSRGAKHVTFADIDNQVIQTIKENASRLKIDIDAADFLSVDFHYKFKHQFDIVFLDPPFKQDFISKSISFLEENDLLKPHAFIYLEFEKNGFNSTQLPATWRVKRHQKTKTLEYVLCEKQVNVK